MKILIIYAHPDPKSFCHAILEQFSKGVAEAGHSYEVVDLYKIGFNPVLTNKDLSNWLPDENAMDVVEKMVKERIYIKNVSLLQKLMRWWLFRNKSPLEIINWLKQHGPKDVRIQQQKVAAADALVFISPVWFVGFPAILKGWIERVFTLGFAFSITSAGWYGDIGGRLPLLRHEKALIINTTIFSEASYEREGLKAAMKKLIDDFSLHYPGIKKVEHEYLHGVTMADAQTLKDYLERAYLLGKEFKTEVRKPVIV